MPSIRSTADTLGFGFLFVDKTELSYIKSVFQTFVEFENIKIWAGKLRKILALKELKKLTRDIYHELDKKNGTESFSDILTIVENPITDYFASINNDENGTIKLISVLDQYLDKVENNIVDAVGLSTGYNYVDHCCGGGMRNGSILMISARKKTGKSFLAMNISLNVAKRGIPVLYADSELSEEIFIPRALSHICFKRGYKISIDDIETGKYARSNLHKQIVREAKEELKQYPIEYIKIAGKNFEQINSIIKRWLFTTVKGQQCLFTLDYFKLNSQKDIGKNLQEYQALGFYIVDLQNLAIKYNFPILTFGQTNRAGIHDEGTDTQSGSDRIIDIVSSFMVLKDKSEEEIALDGGFTTGNKKIVPVCSRFGEGLMNNDYINFKFLGKYGTFIEMNTKMNNLAKQKNVNQIKNDKNTEQNLDLGTV